MMVDRLVIVGAVISAAATAAGVLIADSQAPAPYRSAEARAWRVGDTVTAPVSGRIVLADGCAGYAPAALVRIDASGRLECWDLEALRP